MGYEDVTCLVDTDDRKHCVKEHRRHVGDRRQNWEIRDGENHATREPMHQLSGGANTARSLDVAFERKETVRLE